MSATLIHHGHVRLINAAKEYGAVVVALTTDAEILSRKGYRPELSFDQRKEIISAIDGVVDVVPCQWLITEDFLNSHNIDYLVHGDDNVNPISKDRLIVVPRTHGISSTSLRDSAARAIRERKNKKLMLTPGPAAIVHEAVMQLQPVFGRGDSAYEEISREVLQWLREISGQDNVIALQGSATLALEIAAHAFLGGKALLISTGYYSDRLAKLLPSSLELDTIEYDKLGEIKRKYDWVLCAYTETSVALKLDLPEVRELANNSGAKLFVDATASIGLENLHELADVMAFSSCKGLFGLTGGAFIAHNSDLEIQTTTSFYLNFRTHAEKLVTGPYHVMASLFGVMQHHSILKSRVAASKRQVLSDWKDFVVRPTSQPLLCTLLDGTLSPLDEDIVMYEPRGLERGSIVCHLGEIDSKDVSLTQRVKISKA